MAGVLEQFHFLGKELKDNVLKIKGKNFWKEKELKKKKKAIVIRILPFRGICFWSGCYKHFPHLWILSTSSRCDLSSLVSPNCSHSLGLTKEECFWWASWLLGVGWEPPAALEELR